MRVLLDENLPKRLRKNLPGVMALTVQQQGWAGVQNGQLLKLAEAAGFAVLVTADKNLKYQQVMADRKIAIVVLPSNQVSVIMTMVEQLNSVLQSIKPSDFVELEPK